MGPPPPSPRIEGQQNQHPPNHYRKPRPSTTSAPALSSYASLASAPPPSFARKTSTNTSGTKVDTGSSSTGDSLNRATSTSSAADHYRASPRTSSTSSYGGGRGRTGGRGRYDGGRGGTGRGPRGSYGGRGGRGRYDDRFGSTRSSLSSLGEPSRGRGRGSDEGGRFFNNRRGGGRDPSSSGRFDSTSRGRGRGREYMYGGRGGRGGRSYHRGGRGGFNREEGGRGRYGDTSYGGGNDNSYSSFGDNNSVGESHPRSNSFSEDLPAEGPSPGEIPTRGAYQRGSTTSGSDGGRSVSPHPSQPSSFAARRQYGSFSSTNNNNNTAEPGEFRRSNSQEPEPGEEDPNSYYAPSSAKRRREDSMSVEPGEAIELPKRLARDAGDPPSEGPPPLPFGPSAEAGEVPPSAEGVSRANPNDNVDSRLTEEGRWTSPSGISARDSPHGARRLYSGGTQFDDSSESAPYRESFAGRGRGRGRGRGNYRTGRGGRGGNDYNRTGEYGAQREYGGRYGSGDRRLSSTAPAEGGRGPEQSPRTFGQYSDLASTSNPSWRRHEGDDAPLSPRGNDWRKPTPAPRVISSYATLASNPPPRPSPSTPSKVIPVRAPTPEPEKVKTPPPSPGPPSGFTIALTRLADLEAQMEFAHAKHIMLVKRHQVLMAQYEHLEGLPVGLDAFQAELEAMVGAERANKAADEALYG